MLLQLQLRQQQPWLCRLFRKNNVQNKLFHNDRLVTISSWFQYQKLAPKPPYLAPCAVHLVDIIEHLIFKCASLRMIYYDLLS